MIQEYKQILTPEECQHVINLASPYLEQAGLLGGNELDNYRVAQGTWLFDYDTLLHEIKTIVASLTRLPIENQEAPHVVYYTQGGEYKVHYDYFIEGEEYYNEEVAKGGQRRYSVLFYLNDVPKGGETHFPNVDQTTHPELGKVVVWDNVDKNGIPDKDSLHAGLPVTEGEKWILIFWVRENKFTL